MATSFNIVEGDLERDLRIVVDVNDTAEDISDNLGVTMRWLKPDGTFVEDRELVEDVAAGGFEAGCVKCVWEAGDTDVVGVHEAQVVVVRGNGETQTFPSNGRYVKWTVYAKLSG
jgi:hypothetical protein